MVVEAIRLAVHRANVLLCTVVLLCSQAGCDSENRQESAAIKSPPHSQNDTKFHFEISQSAGRLPVLLLLSGGSGAQNYVARAKAYAGLGFYVVLLDSNQYRPYLPGALEDLRETILLAQKSPHALPGKVLLLVFPPVVVSHWRSLPVNLMLSQKS